MICICCNKESYNKKEFYILHGVHREEGEELCKDCAEKIGIKNSFSACMYTKNQLLKKYSKINPSFKNDNYSTNLKEEFKTEITNIKNEIAVMKQKSEEKKYLASLKEMKQEKYICSDCGEIWFENSTDALYALANISNGSLYALNQVKNIGKCPKCKSRAFTHTTVKYWVDKQGNCVKKEE